MTPMRRLAGLLLIIGMWVPCYNVGLVTYAMPFSDGETAYGINRGESCADSFGAPPWLGFYGSCGGRVTSEPIKAVPDGRANNALEDEYEAVGTPMGIYGPRYGNGYDSQAGKEIAAGKYPTDVVTTIGWGGEIRAVEPPTGSLLILGVISPALVLAGIALLFWPRRGPHWHYRPWSR